jgi:hypothetical protein
VLITWLSLPATLQGDVNRSIVAVYVNHFFSGAATRTVRAICFGDKIAGEPGIARRARRRRIKMLRK